MNQVKKKRVILISIFLSMNIFFTTVQLLAGIFSNQKSKKCLTLLRDSETQTAGIFSTISAKFKLFLANNKFKKSTTRSTLNQTEDLTNGTNQILKPKNFRILLNAKSIKDLKKINSSEMDTDFINAINSENFSGKNPFDDLNDMTPIVEILKKGIVSIDRKTYRTFINEGYNNLNHDVVTYTIYHLDNTISIIQTMRHAHGIPYAIGVVDLRATHLIFYNSNQNGKTNYRWYIYGKLEEETLDADYNQGLDAANNFINSSLNNREMIEIFLP